MGYFSLKEAYLLGAYFEALVYGGLMAGPLRVVISISAVMFFIATFHLAINCYRLLQGYTYQGPTHSGPVAYLSNRKAWHFILKDFLYATQENLGSAAAIYRTWVLRSYNWKIIVLPIILLTINIKSAALQIITEFIFLVSIYSYNNSQYIVLEWITPLVGITFNSITVRVKFQSFREAGMETQGQNNPVQTIASMPLRRININTTEEV
ncbi:hypothetical protein BDQ17DRAFT_1335858 [Cyathus striatus]|nr:hypothetical protein BDQ17DRAFT_1335858 [Cyathus striatus]